MGKGNVHLVLNSRDRVSGTYNSSEFASIAPSSQTTASNKFGSGASQNLIQGDIKDVSVSEVNFPYDIPNIQAGPSYTFNNPGLPTDRQIVTAYSTFFLAGTSLATLTKSVKNEPGPYDLILTVPAGFYSGTALADEINTLISDAQTALGEDPKYAPTFTFEEGTNRFVMNAPETDTAGGNTNTPAWAVYSPYTFSDQYVRPNTLGKDILSIMGYTPDQATDSTGEILNYVNADGTGLPNGEGVVVFPNQKEFYSGSAPLTFTQYIDICSPKLCKFQFFRDGSTTNLARRSDVICRLYISNNISADTGSGLEGTKPFIINRQFYNSRVMRWTADNSIGGIDLQLYDDVGQPLTTTWNPRNFQITFNVKENPKDESNYGDGNSLSDLIKQFAPYKDRNAGAWNNLRSIH